MIKCKFDYNKALLDKITANSTKKANFIIEICAFVIFLSSIVLFCFKYYSLAISFLILSIVLAIALIVVNVVISKGNNTLLGQTVEIEFNQDDMLVKIWLRENELASAQIAYNIIKQVKVEEDLIYFYINSKNAVIAPKNSFSSKEDADKAIGLAGNNYVE